MWVFDPCRNSIQKYQSRRRMRLLHPGLRRSLVWSKPCTIGRSWTGRERRPGNGLIATAKSARRDFFDGRRRRPAPGAQNDVLVCRHISHSSSRGPPCSQPSVISGWWTTLRRMRQTGPSPEPPRRTNIASTGVKRSPTTIMIIGRLPSAKSARGHDILGVDSSQLRVESRELRVER